MGYSARYHAFSIIAIFVALAVGIVIGAGFGQDVVTGTSESLEESLEEDLTQERERADELSAELERERTFGLRLYPAITDGRLRNESVGVVAIGALPTTLAEEIEATLEPTGGRLAKVAVVRAPPDLEALSGVLGTAYRNLEENPAAVERLGRQLGRQLVAGGPLVDRAGEQLLDRFSGRDGAIDNVVLVAPVLSDVPEELEETTQRFRDGVLEGVRAANRPTVGVELRSATPSSVPIFDAHDIATVDSLDLTSGKVAAVFALLGAEGSFGVKQTADALLPDVVHPRSRDTGG